METHYQTSRTADIAEKPASPTQETNGHPTLDPAISVQDLAQTVERYDRAHRQDAGETPATVSFT